MEVGMGIVGLGGLGHVLLNIYEVMDGVDVVAGTDVSDGARRAFESAVDAPAYEDLRSLLAAHAGDLDAMTIVTPHTLHYQQASACFDEGLDVLVEKPMVTDITHAVDLVRTAEERDLVLEVGYQRHFHPAFREIRRLVDGGRIGEVHAVNCYLGQDWIAPHQGTWRTNPDLSGGGQLYDTGSHLLDAMLWTTESEPETVSAEIEYAEPEVDVNSALAITLRGTERTVTASVGVNGDGVSMSPTEGYVFWGTQGRLTYADDRLTVTENDGVTYAAEILAGTDFETVTREKLEDFVAAVRGEREPTVPGEVGLQVTALTEAAYRADETGSRVDVQASIEAARQDLD